MNGKDFIIQFKDKVYKSEKIKETYNSRTAYTKTISDIIYGIIKNCGSNPYKEYFRVDYTGWKSNPTNSKVIESIHSYEWEYNIAIEHENEARDWTYELEKLSFIHAENRIVIGYVDNKERKRDENVDMKLIQEQVSKFVYSVDDKEPFYVILMNREWDDEGDPLDLRVYSIVGKTVKQLNDF